MGLNTTVKFKGIVKEEYREAIDRVVNYRFQHDESPGYSEKWRATDVDFMVSFSDDERADFIPNHEEGDIWNKETGEWKFSTSLKNYYGTIKKFFDIVPLFMESVDTCKTRIETANYFNVYALEDGEIQECGIELYNMS